jgi:hypothetical protein
MLSVTGKAVDYTTVSMKGNLATLAYSLAVPASIAECAISTSIRLVTAPLPIGKERHLAVVNWSNESAYSIAISTYNAVANALGFAPEFCDVNLKFSLLQKLENQNAFDSFITAVRTSQGGGAFVKEVSVGPMTYADIQELVSLCPNIEVLDLSKYGKFMESDYDCILSLNSLKEKDPQSIYGSLVFPGPKKPL